MLYFNRFDSREETEMKKMTKFVTLAAAALTSVFALSGCSFMSSVTYANAEKYSAGDAEITDKIERIEIDWQSGSVNIVSHSENTFLLSEKTEEGISDDLRVHWWLEDTTLHVKFAKSGTNLRLFRTRNKELTLTVPETVSLNDITIHSASAEIHAEGLAAETLSVSTASGNITVGCTANTVKLGSASGNIELTGMGKAERVGINTASGKIHADLGQADQVNLESTSGKIHITAASIDSLSAKAASGAVSCELDATPSECRLRAVSGAVTLILPDTSDFTAKISTASGDFASDFALKTDGNTYTCGNGNGTIDIETASGDVSIRKK